MNSTLESTVDDAGLASRFQASDLVPIKLVELVSAYLAETRGKRLLLPTIQRSLVWTNEQIVNYWDSLLRGWFPGLMLVHDGGGDAYDRDDKKTEAAVGDCELLDGQQRMAAILLGFGTGPLAKTRRLWVDLDGETDGKHRFALRITSPGQPFGYQKNAPNSRLSVVDSRKAWDAWLFNPLKQGEEVRISDCTEPQQIINALRQRYEDTLAGKHDYNGLPTSGATDEDVSKALLLLRPWAFSLATGADLSGTGKNVFPLGPLMRSLARRGLEISLHEVPVQNFYEQQASETFESLVASNKSAKGLQEALADVLDLSIAVKKVEKELFTEKGAYEVFFERIGRGGTALSPDELAYSLIKARIPEAREALEAIVRNPEIGRLTNPTQIAIAGLRLARIRAAGNTDTIWDRIGRPTPDFVSSLPCESDAGGAFDPNGKDGEKRRRAAELAIRFRSMLPQRTDEETAALGNCELAELMKELRRLLGDEPAHNPGISKDTKFPAILLGRLPKEMIDIGLMLVGLDTLKHIDSKLRRAFCLWCLTFADIGHAANVLAEQTILAEKPTDTPRSGEDLLRAVIKKLEDEGKARLAPTRDDIRKLRNTIPTWQYDCPSDPLLQSGNERFKATDVDPRVTVAINEMKFNSSRGKNALLWLQREYLRRHFPSYDPTSDRDEDLPIDLDHIVPQERFGFHWQEAGFPEGLTYKEHRDTLDNLWRYRGEVGNLLGNLRWLSSSENRSRGADMSGDGVDTLKGTDDILDLVVDVSFDFKRDDAEGKDATKDVKGAFRYLIDLRGKEGRNASFGLAGWAANDIRLWQYLVATRQLELIRRLVEDSGIANLLARNADGESSQ